MCIYSVYVYTQEITLRRYIVYMIELGGSLTMLQPDPLVVFRTKAF